MIVKLILIFFVPALIICGCSSSKKEPISVYDLPSKPKSRVEIKNEDGTITPIIAPDSKATTIIDPKTGKKFHSEGWTDPSKKPPELAGEYKSLSIEQLDAKLNSANLTEMSLIIEELKTRGTKAVKPLAKLLTDSRKLVFLKNHEYWWYEKKDADPEPAEVRIYAALAMQYLTDIGAYKVVLNITEDRLIYATKDKFAVNKEDVTKVWLQWWHTNKKDYE